MTKKEISVYLLNELKEKGLDINQGFINSILDYVYKNNHNYKFFLLYKNSDDYNDCNYDTYMCSDWELDTQDTYYSKRKGLLHTKNEIIELKFEKRSFKKLTMWSK